MQTTKGTQANCMIRKIYRRRGTIGQVERFLLVSRREKVELWYKCRNFRGIRVCKERNRNFWEIIIFRNIRRLARSLARKSAVALISPSRILSTLIEIFPLEIGPYRSKLIWFHWVRDVPIGSPQAWLSLDVSILSGRLMRRITFEILIRSLTLTRLHEPARLLGTLFTDVL